MDRIIVRSKVGSDGVLHLQVPIGQAEADTGVHVTIEADPAVSGMTPTTTAAELLQSDLVGLWADRTDLGDSQEFARRLREKAQTRRPDA